MICSLGVSGRPPGASPESGVVGGLAGARHRALLRILILTEPRVVVVFRLSGSRPGPADDARHPRRGGTRPGINAETGSWKQLSPSGALRVRRRGWTQVRIQALRARAQARGTESGVTVTVNPPPGPSLQRRGRNEDPIIEQGRRLGQSDFTRYLADSQDSRRGARFGPAKHLEVASS